MGAIALFCEFTVGGQRDVVPCGTLFFDQGRQLREGRGDGDVLWKGGVGKRAVGMGALGGGGGRSMVRIQHTTRTRHAYHGDRPRLQRAHRKTDVVPPVPEGALAALVLDLHVQVVPLPGVGRGRSG